MAKQKKTKGVLNALMSHAKQQQQQASESDATDHGTITVYKNGFEFAGAFRDSKDAKNAQFLKELMQGFVPQAIEEDIKAAAGPNASEVKIQLKDKRSDVYVPPVVEKKFDFGASQGNSLGGSSSSSDAKSSSAAASFQGAKAREFKLDASKPQARVQIILIGGKKAVVKFNTATTVLALYEHVMFLSGKQAFPLVAGCPPKALTAPSATSQSAKLNGARVQQK
jgi:hypothetical protein